MWRLKEIYFQYADRVDFLAVDADPTEDPHKIRSYKEAQGYTWDMALNDREMMRSYNIIRQASKVVVDGNGIILFRTGYGSEPAETWNRIFEGLTAP